MESKDQFFKNVIWATKNLINPCKTCEGRHKLAHVNCRYNGLFPRKFELPGNVEYVKEIDNASSVVIKNRIGGDALLVPTVMHFSDLCS